MRIELQGGVTLNGTTYELARNDGNNHLHGGEVGFDEVLWEASVTSDSTLKLNYISEDMEEGYPGLLDVTVTYSLSHDNALEIHYEATTTKATPINLTNHSYFNLTGKPDSTILNHRLKLNASDYTPVNEELIPTGEIASVQETPFDFTEFHSIGERIGQIDGEGYDHNYVLNKSSEDAMTLAASVYSPVSGRQMKVYTTEPGVQFYTGNFLDGSFENPEGIPYRQYWAFVSRHSIFLIRQTNLISPQPFWNPGRPITQRPFINSQHVNNNLCHYVTTIRQSL